MNECGRHMGIAKDVVRCTHIGERFVVEIRRESGYTAVDYVEDLPDDGLLIESTDWYHPDQAVLNAVWLEKVSRMRADVPPDPERAYIHCFD